MRVNGRPHQQGEVGHHEAHHVGQHLLEDDVGFGQIQHEGRLDEITVAQGQHLGPHGTVQPSPRKDGQHDGQGRRIEGEEARQHHQQRETGDGEPDIGQEQQDLVELATRQGRQRTEEYSQQDGNTGGEKGHDQQFTATGDDLRPDIASQMVGPQDMLR
ncbi:hypothetical protein SDC9_192380 [bioreactor metagenome]|uniref:Uncharacterized protein n=1 Tax=bioreactor metagenome TaxID=1076179 RepID=A0A645IBK6_9ZZZZ